MCSLLASRVCYRWYVEEGYASWEHSKCARLITVNVLKLHQRLDPLGTQSGGSSYFNKPPISMRNMENPPENQP
jgi:hypothetical protein